MILKAIRAGVGFGSGTETSLPPAHVSQWHQRSQKGQFLGCGDDRLDLLPQELLSSYEDLCVSGKDRNKEREEEQG